LYIQHHKEIAGTSEAAAQQLKYSEMIEQIIFEEFLGGKMEDPRGEEQQINSARKGPTNFETGNPALAENGSSA